MSSESIHPAARVAVGIPLLALVAGLLWSVVSMPAEPVGLTANVHARLQETGVDNPVTAVLLSFRAYDTMLEMAVLALAVLAIWSLQAAPTRGFREPAGRVLSTVVTLLVPLMILVGGYLLWTGTSAPGGAFHGGATLAAAGVLLLLADIPALRAHGLVWRAGVVLGLSVFLVAGVASIAAGGAFLEYPEGWAHAIIVGIEACGTISIGLILIGIFAGHSDTLTRPHEAEEGS